MSGGSESSISAPSRFHLLIIQAHVLFRYTANWSDKFSNYTYHFVVSYYKCQTHAVRSTTYLTNCYHLRA